MSRRRSRAVGRRFPRSAHHFVFSLAFLGLACASASSSRPSGDSTAEAAARLGVPVRVAGLEVVEVREFRDPPGAGALDRYQGKGGFEPDVFLYPIPVLDSPAEVSQWLAKEGQLFRELLSIEKSRGRFDSFVVEREREIDLPVEGGTLAGYEVKARLERRGDPRDSYLYLVPMEDRMLKVRASHRPETASDKEVAEFVEALVGATVMQAERR